MLVLTGSTLEHVTGSIFKAAPHAVVGRVHQACGKVRENIPNAVVALRPMLGRLGSNCASDSSEIVLAFSLCTAFGRHARLMTQVLHCPS